MSGNEGGIGLDWLADRPGARRPRKRVGRGPGSGRGKTSGRGVKGQNSRSGTALGVFEGGQMPIHMRMPKRGFRNVRFAKRPIAVNLDRLQQAVDAGKLDPGETVDLKALKQAGVVSRAPDGVRILGRGVLKQGLSIEAVGISAAAKSALEAAGGSFEARAEKRPPKKAKSKKESAASKSPPAEESAASTAADSEVEAAAEGGGQEASEDVEEASDGAGSDSSEDDQRGSEA